LVDSEPLWCAAFQRAFRLAGWELENAFFYEQISFRGVRAQDLLANAGKDACTAAVLCMIRETMAKYLEENAIAVFPTLPLTLSRLLSKGLRNIVVSNSPADVIEAVLSHHGVMAYFDGIIGKTPSRPGKPAPDAYLAALTFAGVDAMAAMAVEDSETGLAAAAAAGIEAVLLETPANSGLQTDRPFRARLTHDHLAASVR